jgi:Pilin (bacterial filament)
VITISYGNQANALIAGKILSINAYVDGRGDIVWVCGMRYTGQEALNRVGEGSTTVPPKFLSSMCKQ